MDSRAQEQRSSLLHAEAEVQQIKSEYLTKINHLEDRLAKSTRERHLLQAKLSQASQSLVATSTLPETTLRHEVEDLKRSLNHLRTTDLQYVELQGIPEAKRSLADQVRIKVYELTHELQTELKAVRRQRENERQDSRDSQELHERIHALKKQLDEKDEAISVLKVDHLKMANEYQTLSERLQSLHAESSMLDETKQQMKVLQDQISTQTEQVQTWKTKCLEQETLANSMMREKEETRRKMDLLQLDKSYLEKEVVTMGSRVKVLEEKLAQRSSELETLKEDQLNQFQRILQTSEKQRNEYEIRLQEELSNIRQRTNGDLDDIRRNTKEMYEREIKTLKDSFTTTREDYIRMERALEHSQKGFSETMSKFSSEKARLEGELASASQQAKMKSFECDRLRILYEDTLGTVRRLQLDNEKYLKKIDVITKEFHDLRTESGNRIAQLENMKSGRGLGVEGQPSAGTTTRIELDDNLLLKGEISKRKALEWEVKMLTEQLGRIHQPQTILVGSLAEKDRQLLDLEIKYQQLEAHTKNMLEEKKVLVKERGVLLEDVRQLTQNRKQMDQIRKAMTQMAREISAK